MTKQLYRSNTSKVFGGVAGGLGEYFDVDPVIIRVIFVVSVFAWGLSLLVYLGLWIFVPQNDEDAECIYPEPDLENISDDGEILDNNSKLNRRMIAGYVLIVFGVIIMLGKFMPEINLLRFWPLFLVGMGAYIIYKSSYKRKG